MADAAGLVRSIQMKTEIPGPKSQELLERHRRVIPRAIDVHVPAVVERAEGALVIDVDGNVMIDFTGGVGVLNVGHANPRVVKAVQDQAARFTHTDYSIIPYEPLIRLAERITELAPGRGPKKAFFFNSGAEAVENAVKVARLYTGRRAVIAFEGAFHGRTWMALSLTGRGRPYKVGLGPFVPDVYRAPFPYTYRKPYPVSDEEYADICADRLERMLRTEVPADDVAAVIVEPVQGEGGFVVPPANFLPRVQDICRRYGIVFIVDEVQTGFGRTGRLFASEHFDLDPDIVCIAKSLAGGMPLSGIVGKAEVMDAAPEGAIGGTYVGNPVACAAALAVLDEFAQTDLLENGRRVGSLLRQGFEELARRYAVIGEVRGLGPMLAMELVRDRKTREPDADLAGRVIRSAMQRGLLLLRAGIYGNVIRVLAPLTLTAEQAAEALDVLRAAFDEALQDRENQEA
ncbi:MAG: 4-aminobutyrate--2-oxoglutarate transaminase [Thermaerobacter sp.]